jgi:hypothetical protein
MGRERMRQIVSGELDPELIRQRQASGWRLSAIEWERDIAGTPSKDQIEVPYGLRIGNDCHHLEEDPDEAEILRLIMRGVVHDQPLSKIAEDLNQRYRTRSGGRWTSSDVFRLMPTLVDSGPRIFADPAWPRAKSA